ncbi:MAG: FKBP-type peptidyl-prolyl cis-trans isomerase [Ferruginibacter sp.]
MRNISFLLLAALTMASCKDRETFKKGQDGLDYKIISTGNNPVIKPGEVMQIEIMQYYQTGGKDSLLSDSRENNIPVMEVLDSTSLPPAYYKIFEQAKKGDSIVIQVLTDSMFKDNMAQMPPFLKKGHLLVTHIKIADVFKDREAAEVKRKELMEIAKVKQEEKEAAHIKIDDDILQKYFADNKINAVKSPNGMYVEILTPGTGPMLDTTMVAEVNYTGKTIKGKAFDSNVDPAFNHAEPFYVNLTSDPTLGGGVIAGWSEGLKMLNKGAKARFYIPSGLAYGSRGVSADIVPFSNLIFDIDVTDVLNKQQARVKTEKEMSKRMEMQKLQELQQQLQQQGQPQSQP